MPERVVLILGGYGTFGSLIADSLARHPELSLIIAGRNLNAAATKAKAIPHGRGRALGVDVITSQGLEQIVAARPAVVVDTVGPFQSRDLRLARQCALNGIHYVDIADARECVAGITELDSVARANGVAVISGASTVPAITTAMVDDLVSEPFDVLEIEVGITPGHRAPRGLATVRSILSKCGKPIPAVSDGVEYGWGGLTRHRYPSPIGSRWLSNVDTPERELWRDRYPSLRNASIRAGLAITPLHLGLSVASRVVRAGLISSLAPSAALAIRIADLFNAFGSDTGGMHVRVVARGAANGPIVRRGTLIAEKGDGPQVPASPAALIVKKLLGLPGYAPIGIRGAHPCMGFLSREEIFEELSPFAIRFMREG
jgi:hypothetical protein